MVPGTRLVFLLGLTAPGSHTTLCHITEEKLNYSRPWELEKPALG